MPVSDADRDRMAVGKTITFHWYRPEMVYAAASEFQAAPNDAAATPDSHTAHGKKTDLEP